MTFASTRALLFDFSALEIQVIRFALAWVVLWGLEKAATNGVQCASAPIPGSNYCRNHQ